MVKGERLMAVCAVAMCLAMGAFAAGTANRVDFTSQPDGADVVVDGKVRGVTPLTLFDLTPGSHRVRFDLRNYESAEEFFTLGEGAYSVRHAALEPLKGLLLVTTEPTGCDVSLDGLSFGETPRLITSLDAKGTYRLFLQKPGYQSRTVEVKFNGRTPVVRHEKLILDSGVLSVASDPSGASVIVNGVARGVTPLTVSDVPKGRATVVVSKEGYLPQTREVALNAGDEQSLALTLEGMPGALYLSSVPDGARFYLNGEARGKGPLSLSTVKPGTYTVRAELEGYGPVSREVTIPLGGEVREEFRLESARGRLLVKTSPPGAQVLVDGHAVGTTKAGYSDETSDVLMVENLDVGEHTLVIRKEGFAEIVRSLVIDKARSAQVAVRMKRVFKPNVELTTSSGVYRGVFVDNTPEAITIEAPMGITRSFPREDIKSIEFIGEDK